ncbi:MAG: hypothetical protein IIB53_01660 [Planctomycetes bacterium]|nr:hypothetical protein [Planctomycetota bacterium]
MLRRLHNITRGMVLPGVVVLAISGMAQTSSGQCELVELLASDGSQSDSFGISVSISGGVGIIGARNDDANGYASGSAYIFVQDGLSWIEQAKLLASDGETYNYFGESVDVSGDVAIVGARWNDEIGFHAGAAYVFRYTADTNEWIEQAKLLASDGASQDEFGFAVAVSGDVAVVGAYSHDHGWNGSNVGGVYVFRSADGGRSWIQEAELLASDGSPNDWFGNAVDIAGDRIIVGAYRNDVSGSNSGSAYIFRYYPKIGVWIEEIRLVPSDSEAGDWFGRHVAIDGEVCLVGATGDDDNGSNAGAAYVYRYDVGAAQWIEEAKLVASDGDSYDNFGPVAIEGNVVVVGAPKHDFPAINAGVAYVYTYDPAAASWNEQGMLVASDNAQYDEFSGAVAIDGGLVIAGARSHDDLGSSSGSAYVFDPLADTDVNNNGIPDACEPWLGDLNSDGVVNSADLIILLAFWGPCPPPPLECLGDLNADEVVGVADLLILLANWS